MQCLHELDKKSGWFNFSLNGVLEEGMRLSQKWRSGGSAVEDVEER